MNRCPTIEELDRFLHDRLDPGADQRVGVHVDECPHCQRLLDDRLQLPELTRLLRHDVTVIASESGRDELIRKLKSVPALAAVQSDDEARPDDLEELETIGKYEVGPVLGRGGMGTVYLGFDRDLGREVAVKVLSATRQSDPRALELARSELKAAGRLSHPNIVSVMNAGILPDDRPWLVMEYLRGVDLESLVRAAGPLTWSAACSVVAAASDGLQHAHERQLVHRDIKPSNLFQTSDGTIKVLDFGLAFLRREDVDAGGLSESGLILGTVDFMSPEQARHARYADHRSDIYSLGCTLYWLMTGRRIYRGESPLDVLVAHRDQPVPDLTAVVPGVPAGLNEIFQRMVAKHPDDRFQSMSELAVALKRLILNIEPVPPTVDMTAPADRGLSRLPVHQRRLGLLSAGAGLIFLLGLILVLKFEGDKLEINVSRTPDATKAPVGNAVSDSPLAESAATAGNGSSGSGGAGRAVVDPEPLASVSPGSAAVPVRAIDAPDGWINAAGLEITASVEAGDVSAIRFCGDGSQLALTAGHRVEIWDVADVASPKRLWQTAASSERHPLKAVAVLSADSPIARALSENSPDESVDTDAARSAAIEGGNRDVVVTAGLDGLVRFFRRGQSEPVRTLPSMTSHGGILSLAVLRDEPRVLASCYHWQGGRLLDVNVAQKTVTSGFVIEPEPSTSGSFCTRVVIAPDQKWLAAASRLGRIAILKMPELTELKNFTVDGRCDALAIAPDSRTLAAGCEDGPVRVWDVATQELMLELPDSKHANAVCFTPDGEWLIVATDDRFLKAVRLSAPAVPVVRSIRLAGESLAVSADGRLLAVAHGLRTGKGNGHVELWKLPELLRSGAASE